MLALTSVTVIAVADSNNVHGSDKDSGLNPFDHGVMLSDENSDAEDGEISNIIPDSPLATKTNP